MRKQLRPAAPLELAEHADHWNRQWVDLRKRNVNAKFTWYQVDGRKAREWILPTLRLMNQGHCSFCDTFPLEDRSAEPIEHFRPKTNPRFAMLAFAWENLYYCCELCQKTKRGRWDDKLVRPDDREYSLERFFIFDFTTGEIQPNPKASSEDQAAAITTIMMYGLDLPTRRKYRRLELRRWQRTNLRDINSFAYRDFVEHGPAVE